MRLRRAQPHHLTSALLASTVAAVMSAALALPGAALASTKDASTTNTAKAAKTKLVRYHGVQVKVPAGWPVFHVSASSTVCVRFSRHAVYLGNPGSRENCPMQPAGRTEAILISPATKTSTVDGRGVLAPVSTAAAARAGGSMARVNDTQHHVVITATWNRNRGTIRRALNLRSLRPATRATNGHAPAPGKVKVRIRPHAISRTTSVTAPATPGAVYTGLGFDACQAPSATQLAAWGLSSPYAAVGIYIGGADIACSQPNLNASWVSAESASGWHMIPIYVGLQAPVTTCPRCTVIVTAQATTEGTAAAQDAVAQAQSLGIGTGNPIYFDMEGYKRTAAVSAAVLAFLQAWTQQLHLSGYLSGVYSSGSSGITDLASEVGTGYLEPDDIWDADWNSSSTYVPANADDPYLPSTAWADNQRLIQYYGSHNVTYGGTKLSIDSDYIDGATAAYGSAAPVVTVPAAPSIRIKPQADGSVRLMPTWRGEQGITKFQILAGASPNTMTAIQTVSSARATAVSLRAAYPYYSVTALNSDGQVVASSTPVAAPGSVAIFGNSAFVGARGPVGVPVACLNASPCQVQAAIFNGSKRISHFTARAVPRHGGQILFPLNAKIRRLVAKSRRLPVTVRVTGSAGTTAARPLNLVPYTASGKAPVRKIWSSSSLQILSKTNFVSNGWTGGVLAICKTSAPCTVTTHVTRSGVPLAAPRTQTLGPGEIGYLTFAMNDKGHALLKASSGNQLGARVTVTPAVAPGAVGLAARSSAAMALISLASFR